MIKAEQVKLHKVGFLNERIDVYALHDPGPGGAHTHYEIDGFGGTISLEFQNGDPAKEVNGVTNEAILAVLIHRMQGFQRGPFACDDNAESLDHLEKAMAATSRPGEGTRMSRSRRKNDTVN